MNTNGSGITFANAKGLFVQTQGKLHPSFIMLAFPYQIFLRIEVFLIESSTTILEVIPPPTIDLVGGSALSLPEAALGGGTIDISGLSTLGIMLAVHSAGETREDDDEGSKEEENHSGQLSPDADAKLRMASTTILIDVILNDTEQHEVGNGDDQSHDKCKGRYEGCEERTADASAKSEEESDERHSACDGVENHDAREGLRGVFAGLAEVGGLDFGHLEGGVVADVSASAEIFVAIASYITNTVAKGTESDTGVADGGLIGESHRQH